MASTPIADLSYRHYDGPLEAPFYRWWAIAKMTMRLALKKRGFWWWSILSGSWYFMLGVIFYFMDVTSEQINAASGINASSQFFANITWKDQFLNGFSSSQLFLFILSLLIGAGAIANDNRANALLVYLSKPCSKLDYLIGKWFGVFLLITMATAIPTLIFFGYCYMSYRQYNFLEQDPMLFWKLLAIIPIPAAFHASVSLGISSLFNQGRMAGATYAGLYFITYFFTTAMGVVRIVTIQEGTPRGAGTPPPLVDTLFYGSVDGIQIALAKNILGTRGSPLFNAGPRGMSADAARFIPPIPSALLFGSLYVAICALFLYIAWRRIRAVEVVA
jgi:ABC-2 type transport system permease protein